MNYQDMDYQELTKEKYKERIEELSFYLRTRSIKMGESLMPHDVSELMDNADRSGKFKYLLFNGFINCYGKLLFMIDIYEGVGFEMPIEEKECNIDNLQKYF